MGGASQNLLPPITTILGWNVAQSGLVRVWTWTHRKNTNREHWQRLLIISGFLIQWKKGLRGTLNLSSYPGIRILRESQTLRRTLKQSRQTVMQQVQHTFRATWTWLNNTNLQSMTMKRVITWVTDRSRETGLHSMKVLQKVVQNTKPFWKYSMTADYVQGIKWRSMTLGVQQEHQQHLLLLDLSAFSLVWNALVKQWLTLQSVQVFGLKMMPMYLTLAMLSCMTGMITVLEIVQVGVIMLVL